MWELSVNGRKERSKTDSRLRKTVVSVLSVKFQRTAFRYRAFGLIIEIKLKPHT